VNLTLTRGVPAGWPGLTGRVDAVLLAGHTIPPAQAPHLLVCGPTGFVETVAGALIELGHDPDRIKTERFGASGGPS
jgi:ferredoxin-NADP reductase